MKEVRVRDVMTAQVTTLSRGQSIPLAGELMKLARVRHLPVVDESGRLVGLVTHRDLMRAQISSLAPLDDDERDELSSRVPVARIMRTDVWTIAPDATALSAARLIRDHHFGCLPVVEADRTLVGILTESDLVSLLIESLLIDATHLRKKPSGALVDRKARVDTETDAVPSVRAAMTPYPATIDETESVGAARRHMERERIRHLPVTRGGELVGLVSERDLRVVEALGPERLGIGIGGVCHSPPFVVSVDARLDAVAQDMADQRVGSALVVEGGELVGIVTSTDVARALAEHLRKDVDSVSG